MNTDDTIEIRGLSRWLGTYPRSHHLDLTIRTAGQRFRACLLQPSPGEFTVYLYAADGRPVRDNGDPCTGSMADAVLYALGDILDVAQRPSLLEATPAPLSKGAL